MTQEQFISQFHPKVRPFAIAALQEANAALTGPAKAVLTSVLRDPKEQAILYAKGRTTPGPKVTDAPPGSSYHEYGLAGDFSLQINGKNLSWDTRKDWDGDRQSDWMEVVVIFKKHGFKWGGDWHSFKDMPHFDMTFGYNWRTLLKKRNAKDFIPGTQYLNI